MSKEYTSKPQIFTLGAEGPTGNRLFFFQSVEPNTDEAVFLKCEKSQIVAMVNVLELLLKNLPPEYEIPLEDLEPQNLNSSTLPWIIGDLNIFYSLERDEIEIQVSKLVLPDEGSEEPELALDPENIQTIKFILTREQADGFLRMARKLIDLGRPLCTYCSAPLNDTPESNFCFCWN